MRSPFGFPNPVDEHAARLVAAGVVVLCAVTIIFDQHWLLVPIAYGFVARVLTGPKLSPLGRLVTRVVIPSTGWVPELVPGPPKRFARGIGAVFSLSALTMHFAFGATAAAEVVLGALAVAATLEAAFGLCLGCVAFRRLMRLGVIPASACEACDDLWGPAVR